MLVIENLQARVDAEDGDGREILKGVSLEVPAGEVHAIMGPNGCGKSTLSYVLSGREGYEITGGSMRFDGEDLAEMEPEERAAAGVFLSFQYPVEIPGVPTLTFIKEALNAQNLLAFRNPGGFAGEIYETFTRQRALPQGEEK